MGLAIGGSGEDGEVGDMWAVTHPFLPLPACFAAFGCWDAGHCEVWRALVMRRYWWGCARHAVQCLLDFSIFGNVTAGLYPALLATLVVLTDNESFYRARALERDGASSTRP
jgi:hypothetical protein